ncbi:hypothetical protein BC937DRAFT_92988 [Endogone sp. FLAS-F59071]|nr:hypothetical protein BC937DRAFT_92988 [Endogone sp. FLAS-F59071]|eukprot:RUS21337.1 hypothetical protein BC937DRAFT_92988 [Endogone sp. FLAS-F59071]
MNDQTNPFLQNSFSQNSPQPAANPWSSPSATTTPLPSAFPFGSMRMPEPQIPGRNAPTLYNSQTFPGGRINSPTPQNAWDNTPSAPPTAPFSPTIEVEPRNVWDSEHPGGNAYEHSGAPASSPGGNAYQFSGTRYGSEPVSPQPAHTAPASARNTPALTPAQLSAQQPSQEEIATALPPVWRARARDRPSKTRLYLRIAQALASAGSFAFQFSASPVSVDRIFCWYLVVLTAI